MKNQEDQISVTIDGQPVPADMVGIVDDDGNPTGRWRCEIIYEGQIPPGTEVVVVPGTSPYEFVHRVLPDGRLSSPISRRRGLRLVSG